MKVSTMSQAELAAYIQEALKQAGIDVVMTGGAVVALYSEDKYTSLDIDLVNTGFSSAKQINATMRNLGFKQPGKHFVHPDSKYLVEFVAGPLSVGEETIQKVNSIRLKTGLLKVLSPTDCVKDRLAAFYHWGDRNSLEQAVLVSRAQRINLANIQRWSKSEGKEKEFLIFRRKLKD